MTAPAATLLALAAAVAGSGTNPGGGAGARSPIFLTAVEQPGRVVVEVRAQADAPFAGRYTLETVSGGNRTHQSGNARLTRGGAATFITLNLSAAGAWSAVLRVEPDGGAPYEQRLGTSEPSPENAPGA